MDTTNSACSSGCESGWTTYFDQISNHTGSFNPGFVRPFDEYYAKGAYAYEEQETDGQDLSMVSDASSAPPIADQFSGGGRLQKKKIKEQQNLYLDDTATSPLFHFSQDNVRSVNNTIVNERVPYLSRGTAVENFEGTESTRKKHLGFLKSSIKGKSEGLLGRKKH